MSDTRPQVARFAAIFAGGTMLSRVTGIARDIVVAALIPARERDAFLFAFSISNMLRDMLGEGAANAAFVPTFAKIAEQETPQAYRRAIAACFSAMFVVLGLVSAAGILLMPLLPRAMELLQPLTHATPRPPEEMRYIVLLLQWTFPYLLLIGLTAFASAPLFVARRYGTPSWSPMLLNVALIASAWLLRDYFASPAWALVCGAWIGGVLQLAVVWWDMARTTGATLPSFQLRHPAVRHSMWLLGPVIIGQSAGEVNKLVDRSFAIMLGSGTVSAMFYANLIVMLPLAIFGTATSVAILPEISRAAARGDEGRIRETLMLGLAQTTFLLAPAMALLILLSEPIVRLLLERGEFGPEQAAMTAAAVRYFGAGLLSFAWVKVCVQGFYATHDTRTPVLVAAASMVLNIGLILLLVGPLGFRGLALATAISYSVNAALLFALLSRRYGPLLTAQFASKLGRIGLAIIILAIAAYAAQGLAAQVPAPANVFAALAHVAVPSACGGLAYLLACHLLRVEELRDFVRLVRRRTRA